MKKLPPQDWKQASRVMEEFPTLAARQCIEQDTSPMGLS